ncbi:hypothetical protein FRC07_002571, partial [Ceratobasidium sp. 392]
NTQPGSAFSFTPPQSPQFVVTTSAICVNALWFLSLSLSVGVSLVAMLGKDWARAYMAELTGQPYQQARKRQQRWDALEKWRMPQVITFLPTLLHLALLLFAIGLTINLWSVHLGAAIPVLVVTLAATGVYAVSTILPLVRKNCPYTYLHEHYHLLKTHLEVVLPTLKEFAHNRLPIVHTAFSYFIPTLKACVGKLSVRLSSGYRQVRCLVLRTRPSDLEAPDPEPADVDSSDTSKPEENKIDDDTLMDSLTSRAIAWLLVNYEDTKSADVALQAIAGASSQLPMGALVKPNTVAMLLQRTLSCRATRQKTGKVYLKDPNLLEPAILYGRALNALTRSRAGIESLDLKFGFLLSTTA